MTTTTFARRHNSGHSSGQVIAAGFINDIDYFVDVDNLQAGPAVGADFTILNNGHVLASCARCVVVTMFNANSGAARTIAVRIEGVNQFGDAVSETLDFAGGAGAVNTTYWMSSQWAYIYITRVQYLSRAGGGVQANDRLDVGLVGVNATAAGTRVATNGAAGAKAFGLPMPIGDDAALGALPANDFPRQITGVSLKHDNVGAITYQAMTRGAEFAVDQVHSTLNPEEDLLLTGSTAGAGNASVLYVWVHTTRGD